MVPEIPSSPGIPGRPCSPMKPAKQSRVVKSPRGRVAGLNAAGQTYGALRAFHSGHLLVQRRIVDALGSLDALRSRLASPPVVSRESLQQ